MNTLYLDTSSSFLYAAIFDGKDIIASIEERLAQDLSSVALQRIVSMINSTGLNPADINKIIAVNGPGSFTGIRIGLTIAKTYAWSLDIPIVLISSLEAMALSYDGDAYIVPCIDARREYVYAGIYDNNKKTIINNQYISIGNLMKEISKLKKDVVIVTNDKINIDGLIINNYNPNMKAIIENSIDRKPTKVHEVDADYLKKTEAEENHDNKS